MSGKGVLVENESMDVRLERVLWHAFEAARAANAARKTVGEATVRLANARRMAEDRAVTLSAQVEAAEMAAAPANAEAEGEMVQANSQPLAVGTLLLLGGAARNLDLRIREAEAAQALVSREEGAALGLLREIGDGLIPGVLSRRRVARLAGLAGKHKLRRLAKVLHFHVQDHTGGFRAEPVFLHNLNHPDLGWWLRKGQVAALATAEGGGTVAAAELDRRRQAKRGVWFTTRPAPEAFQIRWQREIRAMSRMRT